MLDSRSIGRQPLPSISGGGPERIDRSVSLRRPEHGRDSMSGSIRRIAVRHLLLPIQLATLALLLPAVAPAEAEDPETAPRPGWTRAILPVVFSTPETGFGFGAGALLTYRGENQSAEERPQSLPLFGLYTVKNQMSIALAPDLTLAGGIWRLGFEISYQKFPLRFYGIGNDTPDAAEEEYTLEGFSFAIRASRRVTGAFRSGIAVDLKRPSYPEKEPGGLLDGRRIPGANGGFYAGAGPLIEWDTRDNLYFPTRGSRLLLETLFYGDALGSDLGYQRTAVDLRHYRSVLDDVVLAGQAIGVDRAGAVPFVDHAQLGDLLRGLYAGRYVDRSVLAGQLELRYPLIGRFRGVVFGGIGQVARRLGDTRLDAMKGTAGAGLRFVLVPRERIHIRFDVGVGPHGAEIYFQFSEAF
ncbi:MAG: BamA/TamA family outer membrane protein [Candidatus Eisenbacteria bacterium]|nr:BamA/TamA family outer membrane protein [Candidatus Latescibacterota bacterium]MBD3303357.1 BamA/TamA family outer membrane protein [Candidatus Eisenbacteria bacterium]